MRIFAFHPKLKLDRIRIDWSYGELPGKLLNIDYLAQNKWRCNSCSISTALNIAVKFAADAALKYFNMKIKSGNLEINPKVKTKYEINNQIN